MLVKAYRHSALIQITAGYDHTCGLKSDGTVECWGANVSGQLIPPADAFTSINAGYKFTCGIKKTDGTGICWGDKNKSLGFITQLDVFVGYKTDTACGLKTDNTVQCWFNYKTDDPQSGTFTYVAAGYEHACGIRDNGFTFTFDLDMDRLTQK